MSLSCQFCAGGSTANFDGLVECAKVLMVVDNGKKQTVAAY